MGWEDKLTRNPLVETLSAPLIPVAQLADLVTENWDEDANPNERHDYRESVRLVLEPILGDVGDVSV